eukprot:14582362-Alexandrium_andersonii.AAC.1
MADCGLRRIAAPTGLGWIADCTSGTLQCKDARRTMDLSAPRRLLQVGRSVLARRADARPVRPLLDS